MKSLITSLLTGVLLVLFFICLAPLAHAQVFCPRVINPVVVVPPAPTYVYGSAPCYRTANVVTSTFGGAAIGALVSSRHDAGKGALIGAGAGLLLGLVADRAPVSTCDYNYTQPGYSTPVYAYSSPYSGYVSYQPAPVYYPTGWISAGGGCYGSGGYHDFERRERDGRQGRHR